MLFEVFRGGREARRGGTTDPRNMLQVRVSELVEEEIVAVRQIIHSSGALATAHCGAACRCVRSTCHGEDR